MEGNHKILKWSVVLLALLNVATIATILYHNYQEKKLENGSIIVNTEGPTLNGRYLRQYVGFDNQQVEAFRVANHHFRPLAGGIVQKIDSLKTAMFTELQQPVPDTAALAELSQQIGDCHGNLKLETFRFFLKLKAVCKPGQVAKLDSVFAPLFKNERIQTGPGRFGPLGESRGRGRRWGP